MSANATTDPTATTTTGREELRIALVLNGGVSLAVWMGGVVHELDLLRRASVASAGPGQQPQPYDRDVFDRWQRLSRSAGTRAVVDVIAGTSAGGLNGAMLATVIAHGGTLDPTDPQPGPWLRERWAELGALTPGHLLPDKSPGRKSPPSLLDGDYFSQQLHDLMARLAAGGASDPDGAIDPNTATDPVTLFLTASGLGAQDYTACDAAGQTFSVADHRFLYRFVHGPKTTYRRGPVYKTQMASDFISVDALAQASRASASFPVAFAPVQESSALDRRPPRVRPGPRRAPSGQSWLMDGGVLDNAPFGPVLDEVARRPVRSAAGDYVDSSRYVLYVVPSSGRTAPSDPAPAEPEPAEPQPAWTSTFASAMRFPSEADLRGDVEELEQLLLDADSSWSDTQRLQDTCLKDQVEANRIQTAATELQFAYVRCRAAGGVWEAITIASPAGTTVLDATATITPQDVDVILSENPLWLPPSGSAGIPLVIGPPGAFKWPWGTGPAEHVLRLMLRSDRSSTTTAITPGGLATIDEALDRVVAIKDALTDELATSDLDPGTDRRDVTRRINEVFGRLDVPAALGAAIRPVADILPTELATAMAVEIVSRCTSARTPLQRSAPFRFLRLGPDVQLPVLAGTTAERQAQQMGDRILFGTQVNHFGAFGAEEWRRWDWLLGRLHGAAHLGILLHADDAWVRKTQLAILAAERSSLPELTDRIEEMAAVFPLGPDGGGHALAMMRDELGRTREGEATLQGLGDRLVEVSPGLSPAVGHWARAVLQREWTPTGTLYRWARWFAEPARLTLWQRLVPAAPQTTTLRPRPIANWVTALLAIVTVGLAAGAFVFPAALAAVLGLLGGIALAVTGLLLAVRIWIERRRRQLRDRVAAAIPELPPHGRTNKVRP